jgi:hypothetical protein
MRKTILKQSIIACVILLFFTVSATAVTQQPITTLKIDRLGTEKFTPTDDSYVSPLHEVNGDLPVMNIRNGGYGNSWYAQIVIKFDLSSLPSDALIISAKLRIFYYTYSDANPAGRFFKAYRLESDWNEETIYGDIVPPCSFKKTSSAVAPLSPGTWITWDVTKDVRKFASGKLNNYGWILKDERYWGSWGIPNTYCRTKEFGTNIPELQISTISSFSLNTYSQGNTIPVAAEKINILNTNLRFGSLK